METITNAAEMARTEWEKRLKLGVGFQACCYEYPNMTEDKFWYLMCHVFRKVQCVQIDSVKWRQFTVVINNYEVSEFRKFMDSITFQSEKKLTGKKEGK